MVNILLEKTNQVMFSNNVNIFVFIRPDYHLGNNNCLS